MNRYRFIDEGRQHLHTLDDQPLIGTSTATGIISKSDALSWWAAELAGVEALTSGAHYPDLRAEFETVKAIRDTVQRKKAMDALCKKYPAFKAARYAHYNTKNQKADQGTDMHAELEDYVNTCMTENGGEPLFVAPDHAFVPVRLFATWAVHHVKRFLSSEGHCYSEPLWVGGITDLYFEDLEGRFAIMDFKSSKDAYVSQFVQCAGYDLQIAENGILDKDGNLLLKPERSADYYAVFPFGMAEPEPKFRYDTAQLQEAFRSAVVLHKIVNAAEN